MKKVLSILLLGLLLLTTPISAQNYSALWKQVKTAQDKDLPKTEYELLTQIADKAETEKAYGQLMKAKWRLAAACGEKGGIRICQDLGQGSEGCVCRCAIQDIQHGRQPAPC